jgi:hypothetical protein
MMLIEVSAYQLICFKQCVITLVLTLMKELIALVGNSTTQIGLEQGEMSLQLHTMFN